MRVRERLTVPEARGWYIGAASGLVWQVILVVSVLIGGAPLVSKILGLALLAVFYAVFLVAGPLLWPETRARKILFVALYWLVSFVLFPLIGQEAVWLWMLVVALAGFVGFGLRTAVVAIAVVVAAQLVVMQAVGFTGGSVFAPIITVIVGASMVVGGVVTSSNGELRVANDEIARLAVVAERARFSRDLHDVLGHHLTVVTVKANLARRLLRSNPDQAERELADVEQLTRQALADLRVAVANYRELTLATELAAASTALSAAGITAELPAAESLHLDVEQPVSVVFAWVLREGVTNVIRHSGATRCWVLVGPASLTVADDGVGCAGGAGNGLRGLTERAALVGAEIVTGRSSRGGFELTAQLLPQGPVARAAAVPAETVRHSI